MRKNDFSSLDDQEKEFIEEFYKKYKSGEIIVPQTSKYEMGDEERLTGTGGHEIVGETGTEGPSPPPPPPRTDVSMLLVKAFQQDLDEIKMDVKNIPKKSMSPLSWALLGISISAFITIVLFANSVMINVNSMKESLELKSKYDNERFDKIEENIGSNKIEIDSLKNTNR